MADTSPTAMVSPFRSPEERRQDRAAKREAVLLTAVRLFNARGFHATSLDDVASVLGISKPTIYHYLGNKEQVLLECMSRGLAMLRAAAEQAREAPGNGLDRLSHFLVRYGKVIMDDFGRCVVRTPEEALSRDGAVRFRAQKREIDGAIRALVEEGIADGSVAPVDPRMATFAIAGALNWAARWQRADGPMAPHDIATQLVAILANGLAAQPAVT